MIILSKEQIIGIHSKLISSTGGLNGIRDEGLLDSALNNPFQTFDGEEFYPTVLSKISRLAYGLIRNHPFIDGNKRIGTMTLLVLLELNDFDVEVDDEDIINIGLEIADGSMDDSKLTNLIISKIN